MVAIEVLPGKVPCMLFPQFIVDENYENVHAGFTLWAGFLQDLNKVFHP
jgi:hypothetical protein